MAALSGSRGSAPSRQPDSTAHGYSGGSTLGVLLLAWLGAQVASVVFSSLGASILRTPVAEMSSAQQLVVFIPVWSSWIAIAWLVARRIGIRIHLSVRPSDVPVGVAAGLALQWAVYGVYRLATWLFGPLDVEGPGRQMVALAKTLPDKWALAVIVGLGAPIAEECLYRGLLQPALIRIWGTDRRFLGSVHRVSGAALGIASAAVWFAAAHIQAVQFVGLALVGAVFGILAHRAGRLGPSIIAHATFNLLSLASLLGLWVPYPH